MSPIEISQFYDKSVPSANAKLAQFLVYWQRWQTMFELTKNDGCTVFEWYADQPSVQYIMEQPLQEVFFKQCITKTIPYQTIHTGGCFPLAGPFGYSLLIQMQKDGKVPFIQWY